MKRKAARAEIAAKSDASPSAPPGALQRVPTVATAYPGLGAGEERWKSFSGGKFIN